MTSEVQDGSFNACKVVVSQHEAALRGAPFWAGSKGKTTTSWLVRGIFEEMQLVTGMVGSLEYSLAVDKLTQKGDLWQPDQEDITLQRCGHCGPEKHACGRDLANNASDR